MCLKLIDIKAKIDKLKLTPKVKTWLIVLLIALIPVVWIISSEVENYRANEQTIENLPSTLESIKNEIKKGNQESKELIVKSNEEIIKNVDNKFVILIDNIETKNAELLKKAIINQNFHVIYKTDTVQVNRIIENNDRIIEDNDCINENTADTKLDSVITVSKVD